VLLVAAHPDDEIIGAGAQLPHWPSISIIYITDGSPRNLKDARNAGFSTRADYAQARRQELEAALNLVASHREPGSKELPSPNASTVAAQHRIRVFELGFVDQEAVFHLDEMCLKLAAHFRSFKPQVVVTHPYEGGHPDHDSAAFAVHRACFVLRAEGRRAPEIIEMTSYHGREGYLVTGEFIPDSSRTVFKHSLTPNESRLKQRLFECFRTQSAVLQAFRTECELFRLAPDYDFAQSPHPGPVYYEKFDWGMTGERWRELAQIAKANLPCSARESFSFASASAAL